MDGCEADAGVGLVAAAAAALHERRVVAAGHAVLFPQRVELGLWRRDGGVVVVASPAADVALLLELEDLLRGELDG